MDASPDIHIDPRRFTEGPGLVTHAMLVTHYLQKRSLQTLERSSGNRYRKLSLAYEGFFSLLAERDHSPGELAARLGISKQACSNTLRELQAQGLIERRKSATDSRSSVVSLTGHGMQLLRDGIDITNELHREFAETLGQERLDQLGRLLEKLCGVLKVELPSYAAIENRLDGDSDRPARLNLLLPALSHYFRTRLAASIQAKGFQGLKPSFGQVLGLISREPRRMQYIGSVLGVSKQAVAVTSAELEALGYVVREADAEDKRQIVLRLSPAGEQVVTESEASVRELEASLRGALAAPDFQFLDEALAQLYFQVVDEFAPPSVLPEKIRQLSSELIEELGAVGARTLARQLLALTRGKS